MRVSRPAPRSTPADAPASPASSGRRSVSEADAGKDLREGVVVRRVERRLGTRVAEPELVLDPAVHDDGEVDQDPAVVLEEDPLRSADAQPVPALGPGRT